MGKQQRGGGVLPGGGTWALTLPLSWLLSASSVRKFLPEQTETASTRNRRAGQAMQSCLVPGAARSTPQALNEARELQTWPEI